MLPNPATAEFQELLRQQVQKRRTFAIISHPDAGKTTLTEKLLLYGGAIRQAGSVKARKAERLTASGSTFWIHRGTRISPRIPTGCWWRRTPR